MVPGQVEVVYAPASRTVVVWRISLDTLPAKATIADAIAAIDLYARFPEVVKTSICVGIWGRQATLQTSVRAEDRIEIYRPLKVDPKEARRLRYRQQGPVKTLRKPPGKKRSKAA